MLLRCGHVPLLRGRVGRVGDSVAIRIEDKLERRPGGTLMLSLVVDGALAVLLLAALGLGLRLLRSLRQLRSATTARSSA